MRATPPASVQTQASSYRPLGTTTLKDGSVVRVGCVGETAIDSLWSRRIRELLRPWGHPWTSQIEALLATPGLGRFYVLHDPTSIDSAESAPPFAAITLCEHRDGGTLGNVWTSPARRRNGAMRALLRATLADFRARGGRALILGTSHGSATYRVYEDEGFCPVETGSGYMVLHTGGHIGGHISNAGGGGRDGYSDSHAVAARRVFESARFHRDESAPLMGGGGGGGGGAAAARGAAVGAAAAVPSARVEPLAWRHYAAAPWLFVQGAIPGVVRNAPLSLMGRISTELPLIELIELQAERARRTPPLPPSAVALVRSSDGALVGFGSWGWEKVIPNAAQLDVFCHPRWWDYAPAMVAALQLPRSAQRFVVTADSSCPMKIALFERAGFVAKALSSTFVANAAQTVTTTLVLLERPNQGNELLFAVPGEKGERGGSSAGLPPRAEQHSRWADVEVELVLYDDDDDDAAPGLPAQRTPKVALAASTVALKLGSSSATTLPAAAPAPAARVAPSPLRSSETVSETVTLATTATAAAEGSATGDGGLRLVWWELGRQEKRVEAVATAAAEAQNATAALVRAQAALLAEARAEMAAMRVELDALKAKREAEKDTSALVEARLAPLRAELAAARLAGAMLVHNAGGANTV